MAGARPADKDWYGVLGAEPSAGAAELRRCYRALALRDKDFDFTVNRLANLSVWNKIAWKRRVLFPEATWLSQSILKYRIQFLQSLKYHPDRQSADAPAGAVEECVQKFIEIEQAWKILGNEETKKEYDLLRHEDELRNMGPVDAQVYLEEMSWNEDDHSFSLSCRCGGKYRVSKDEAEVVTLISCDTCSLIIELLHYS